MALYKQIDLHRANPLVHVTHKLTASWAVYLYSCPIKTHHFSDALSCGLSKVVHKCVMFIDHLGQM